MVIGTRPEAIKMVPVARALQRSKLLRPYIITTGQHADMVDPILRLARVPIDVDLGVGRPGQSVNDIVSAVISGVDGVLTDLRGGPERRARPRLFTASGHPGEAYPAISLVHGDTSSAMAAAVASANAKLPVAHVEAGLRTGDMLSPFPEELNRHIISRIAAFHLAPTAANKNNLAHEGVDSRRVFVTGNTGLDAMRWAAGLPLTWPDPRLEVVDDPPGPVITVTAHRRENWGGGLRRIAEGIATIADERPDVTIVLPLHPNPRVRDDLRPALEGRSNIILTEPLDYVPFAHLLARSMLAITDSGGIQEEAPSVGTPVLVTRETSERQEGVEAGTLRLVGTDPQRIAETALNLMSNRSDYEAMASASNPFGDGHAAERIREALETLVFGVGEPREFGHGFTRDRVLRAAGFDSREIAASTEAAVRSLRRLAPRMAKAVKAARHR